MEKSTRKVEVVPVVLEKHPTADSLSVIKVFGYTVVGNTESWKNVAQAAYIPPDSLVDTRRPEFAWLADPNSTMYYEDGLSANQISRPEPPTYARVKTKKLRGVVSYGLLVPAPEGSKIGDNVADVLGVTHWNPPEENSTSGGEVARGPAVYSPKYDVDAFQRYANDVFVEGELVVITEKIHGANGRWVFHNGEFFCGSRTEWKKEFATPPNPDEIEKQMREAAKPDDDQLEERIARVRAKLSGPQVQNDWWRALRNTPELMKWLQAHPDYIVYGELYGKVKGFPYDCKQGEVKIAVFDILGPDGNWLDYVTGHAIAAELPWVPTLGIVNYNFDKLVELAEGMTTLGKGKHIKEGIVVKPEKERRHDSIGRVQLKIVSTAYSNKDKG